MIHAQASGPAASRPVQPTAAPTPVPRRGMAVQFTQPALPTPTPSSTSGNGGTGGAGGTVSGNGGRGGNGGAGGNGGRPPSVLPAPDQAPLPAPPPPDSNPAPMLEPCRYDVTSSWSISGFSAAYDPPQYTGALIITHEAGLV